MPRIARPDVHAPQIWRDRDKRMLSGNRRVVVTRTVRESDGRCFVFYRGVFPSGQAHGPEYRSRMDRFQRAFDHVS